MPHTKTHLIPLQYTVLAWIAAGSPDGVMKDAHHRITARGLSNREFVVIEGKGATWKATITPLGIRVLAAARKPIVSFQEDEDFADAVFQKIADANGVLVVVGPRNDNSDKQVLSMSLTSLDRPIGKKLALKYRSDSTEWSLTEHFPDLVNLGEVPVPKQLRNLHPIVAEYHQAKSWHRVTADHLSRATRILQALAAESEKRGYTVLNAIPADPSHHNWRPSTDNSHIVIQIGEHASGLMIKEIPGKGSERLPISHTSRQQTWRNSRQYEFLSTGRLEISFTNGYGDDRKHVFRDNRSGVLEDLLPQILWEAEVRHREVVARVDAAKRAADTKRLRWENAVARAKIQIQIEHKEKILEREVKNWQMAADIVNYVAAMRTIRRAFNDPAEVKAAAEWMHWAEEYAERLNPLNGRLEIPADVAFTTDDLKPYMGGLTPYYWGD